MGIGGGSGGGGFKLEKTWRASGTGTQVFNTPSNYSIPFGKYEILVSGRAGSGNPNTPSTVSGFNPTIPSTPTGNFNPSSGGNFSGINPSSGGNFAGTNPAVPSNPTGNFNPPSGGNFAGTNPPVPGGVNSFAYITQYVPPAFSPSNPTGNYNPPSGGNVSGFNPGSTGFAIYNAPEPGFSFIVSNFVCEPTFGAFNLTVERFTTATYGGSRAPGTPFGFPYAEEQVYSFANLCPSPTSEFAQFAPRTAGISSYNPPSGGNPVTNPVTPGTAVFNAGGTFPGNFQTLYINDGFSPSCPSPYTFYESGYQLSPFATSDFYEVVNFTCTPVPGTPGNSTFNPPISGNPVFNPVGGSTPVFNPITPGNINYNPIVPSTPVFNAVGGQNPNFNVASGGNPGSPTNVLGVFFPGGNVGTVAQFVSPTRINRYTYPDSTTYPVDVPPGGYVSIESK